MLYRKITRKIICLQIISCIMHTSLVVVVNENKIITHFSYLFCKLLELPQFHHLISSVCILRKKSSFYNPVKIWHHLSSLLPKLSQ
mmetsp:Transcript_11031/g.22469  ORF Transcript_11031/g.22469 Transcript_11031/m.22469 type:complete len:86 (-) Transcript_11031:1331-1588(-)